MKLLVYYSYVISLTREVHRAKVVDLAENLYNLTREDGVTSLKIFILGKKTRFMVKVKKIHSCKRSK